MSGSQSVSQDRWQEIKDCYLEAAALPPDARRAFVDQRCADDGDLRRELESLLASHDVEGFLDTTVFHSMPRAFVAEASDPWVGKQLGAYRIERVIAIGGMGRVYAATRADGQYDKQVAVKMLKFGHDHDQLLRRFEIERQTLASLDHPNIAGLIDGGATPEGEPYLVMEYVDGEPINAYCDRNRLGVRDRLELFLTVCSAVEFAHRNLVVHRDLKPRNILVDREGRARLLDFGIAKLLENSADGEHLATTATLVRAMTPSYASPEQMSGGAITTATDVYSLAVILYELLTGRRPYDLDGRSDYEIARVICEEEPAAPSVVVTRVEGIAALATGTETLTPDALACLRGDVALDLRKRLKGDLDNILLTALQKDTSLRYASVQALEDDIRRYLNGLPVHARKHTFGYRAWKLVKRNMAMTAVISALAVSLIAGLVGTSLGLSATLQAKAEAESATDYLQDVFAVANPYRVGRDVTVVEQLEEAAARIERDLSERPSVEANVRLVIAKTYVGMWMWQEAVPHLRRAHALNLHLHGEDDPRVADVLSLLGRSLAFMMEPESISIQRKALRIRRQAFGSEHALVAESHASVGFAIWQTQPERIGESIQMYREALAMYERVGHGRHADVGRFTFGLAMMLSSVNKLSEADAAFRKAIHVYKGLSGGHDRYLIECLNRYANFLVRRKQYDAAESALLESIALTPGSDDAIGLMAPSKIMASIHQARGDYAAAIRSTRTAIEAELRRIQDRVPDNDGRVPTLLEQLERNDEASPALMAEALGVLAGYVDVESRGYDQWMITVAHLLLHEGSPEASTVVMEACLHALDGHPPAPAWKTARARGVLGSCLVHLGRYAEAEQHLTASLEGLRGEFGPAHAATQVAMRRMVDLYTAWDKPEKAKAFRQSPRPADRMRDSL